MTFKIHQGYELWETPKVSQGLLTRYLVDTVRFQGLEIATGYMEH